MNRMSESQRDSMAELLEGVASDGPTGLQLDAALDAVAETLLPDTIERYFEAHLTIEPIGQFNAFHGVMLSMTDWRVSKFDHDDVDQIEGKWFLSARDTSFDRMRESMAWTMGKLQAAGYKVTRYKIEETLVDSKCGDVFP